MSKEAERPEMLQTESERIKSFIFRFLLVNSIPGNEIKRIRLFFFF